MEKEKKREANGNVPLFENLGKSAVEKKKKFFIYKILHNIHYRTYYIRIEFNLEELYYLELKFCNL